MRARSLKPAFFANEDLGGLSFAHRLLFEGLWCAADREGRLEDRPGRLRVEIFPYDPLSTKDISTYIQDLSDAGMLLRYAVGGRQYLQVVNFSRHQHPHRNEAESTIPPPNGALASQKLLTKAGSAADQGPAQDVPKTGQDTKPDAPGSNGLATKEVSESAIAGRTRADSGLPVTDSRAAAAAARLMRTAAHVARAPAHKEPPPRETSAEDGEPLPFEHTPRPPIDFRLRWASPDAPPEVLETLMGESIEDRHRRERRESSRRSS